jgi:hypothetical protein
MRATQGIGKHTSHEAPTRDRAPRDDALDALSNWPISISYFSLIASIDNAGSRCGNVTRSARHLHLVSRTGAISLDAESFKIPAAPDLIPDGEWIKLPGGNVCSAKGFKATGAYAGLRASGKKADLALVTCDTDAAVGGTFTTNVMCAAPVLYCKDVLSRKKTTRAILTNAGQANAATGELGYKDSVETAQILAKALNISPDDILIQSTGVIGRRMKRPLQGLRNDPP